MRRPTVILLVIVALLAALTWYMQQPGNGAQKLLNPGPTATYPVIGYVVNPNQGPVSLVTLQDKSGKSITIQLKNNVWMITSAGAEVAADQTAAGTIAANVQSLRIVTTLNPAPDLASIGLDKPAYTATMTLIDSSSLTFSIGNATVTGSGYYVKRADGSIIIVDNSSINDLITLLSTPPYVSTATPTVTETPAPATETPVPSPTAEPSATETKAP